MTKHEIEQHLVDLQTKQIIDGFAPVSRGAPKRFYVMLYVKAKDYNKDMARNLVQEVKDLFPNLDIGVAMASRSK
jgi:hypothetical protein